MGVTVPQNINSIERTISYRNESTGETLEIILEEALTTSYSSQQLLDQGLENLLEFRSGAKRIDISANIGGRLIESPTIIYAGE